MSQLAKSLFKQYWDEVKVPVRHRNLSETEVVEGVWDQVVQSVESLLTPRPIGMLLLGPVGTGKTSLLWLIWRKYAQLVAQKYAQDEEIQEEAEHEDVLYRWYRDRVNCVLLYTHSELVQGLRQSVDESGELSHYNTLFRDGSILLLDDFGRGYNDKAGWNLSLQDEFFDWRWKNNLITFVTTNLTSQQLRSLPGWERVVDRLGDPAWMKAHTIGGKSKRITKSNKEMVNTKGR